MKIAVIPTIRDYSWGAPGQCMGELVRTLRDAEHEVFWFVAPIDADHPTVARLATAGAVVRPLPDPPPHYARIPAIRHGLDRWIRGRKDLSEIMDEFSPDHVFLNQGGTWCGLRDEFFELLRARLGRYSLICHLNQPQAAFASDELRRARALFTGARRIFFPSTWVHRLAETQIASQITNAGSYRYSMRFGFEAPLAWPSCATPHLAMVSRLDVDHKGFDVALRALAVLRSEGIAFHLSIYGSGPDERFVIELARYLGVDGCVELKGYRDDLVRVWAEEEILLLPSRREGSAVALTEAMGFGRPVIATAVGGAPEWLEDGASGFICAAAEVDLLCQTLRRALAARSRWREMGLRAHEKICREYRTDPAQVFMEALA